MISTYKTAKILGLSNSAVYRWIQLHATELERLRIVVPKEIGFKRKVRIADLDKFVEFMENKGAKFPDYHKEA